MREQRFLEGLFPPACKLNGMAPCGASAHAPFRMLGSVRSVRSHAEPYRSSVSAQGGQLTILPLPYACNQRGGKNEKNHFGKLRRIATNKRPLRPNISRPCLQNGQRPGVMAPRGPHCCRGPLPTSDVEQRHDPGAPGGPSGSGLAARTSFCVRVPPSSRTTTTRHPLRTSRRGLPRRALWSPAQCFVLWSSSSIPSKSATTR
jgi:hypothetical protein